MPSKTGKALGEHDDIVSDAQTYGLQQGWQWQYFERPNPANVLKYVPTLK